MERRTTRMTTVVISAVTATLIFICAAFSHEARAHGPSRDALGSSSQSQYQMQSQSLMLGYVAVAYQSMDETDASSDDPLMADPANTPRKGINFLTLLTRGGWFMLPLLVLSIVVVTIGVERFLALRREKIFPTELVDQISMLSMQKGGLDARRVYQICQIHPSSATYVLSTMLMKAGRPLSEMESSVSEAAQREATRLSRTTSWLTLAAAIAPLIGLLGTVWGITQAFYDTTQLVVGQNRAEALAQGIYTALVTTMTGLLIAIPAAILSHYYENRIIQLMNEIEEMAYHLLPQLEKSEGQMRSNAGSLDSQDPEADFVPASNPAAVPTAPMEPTEPIEPTDNCGDAPLNTDHDTEQDTEPEAERDLEREQLDAHSKLSSIQPDNQPDDDETFGRPGSLAVKFPEKFFRPKSKPE